VENDSEKQKERYEKHWKTPEAKEILFHISCVLSLKYREQTRKRFERKDFQKNESINVGERLRGGEMKTKEI
jgi:hypothetical protein